MPGVDAFVPNASDFDPFLFARIGTEANGSDLTALSLLARLGADPWLEAGRLAALPKAAATKWLAERIAKPGTTEADGVAARRTAERLVRLLPKRTARESTMAGFSLGATATAGGLRVPGWAVLGIVLALVTLGFTMNAARVSSTAPDPALVQRP